MYRRLFSRPALLVLGSLMLVGLLLFGAPQTTWAAAPASSANLVLVLQGDALLSIDQLVVRPERPADRVISYANQAHFGSAWGFYDNGTFVFVPANDPSSPTYGTYTYDQAANRIDFSGSRSIRYPTSTMTYATSGSIGVAADGSIVAQVTEESSIVSAAVVNGISFGQNSYKYLAFTQRLVPAS